MRSLTVVLIQPALRYFSYFIQCSEQVKSSISVRYVRLNRSINAFCVGLPGLINSSITPWSSAYCASDISSGPLSIRIFSGYPRFATILASTRTTRCAGIFRSISIARASRLKSSTTLKVQKRRPHVSASCIKSIDQVWLSASGVASGAGLRTGRRCLPLRRKFSLSSW